MFTKLELDVIKFVLTKTSRLATSQFEFNGKHLSLTKFKYKVYCKGIHLLLLVSNAILVASRIHQTVFERVFQNIVIHGMYFIGTVGMVLFEIAISFNREEIAVFINQTLAFNHDSGSLELSYSWIVCAACMYA